MPPFHSQSDAIEIPLPVKGVDRGVVRAKQPPDTIPDCRNVRTFDLRGRVGCGKRSGLGTIFAKAGASGTRTVTGLFPMTLARGVPAGTAGTYQDVAEDWGDYTAGDAPDFLGDYVWLRRTSSQATNAVLGANTDVSVQAGPPVCVRGQSGSATDVWVLVNYKTTNVMEITAKGHAGGGTDNLAHFYMVACRGSDDWTDYIRVRLVDTGVNTAALRIESQTGNSLATIGTSSNLALTEATATVSEDFKLRVTATADTITAYVEWPSKTGDDANWAGFTYSVANTTHASNSRAGFGFLRSSFTIYGEVISAAYTRIVPAEPTVMATLAGTDTESPLTDRYLTPTGWSSFGLTTANVNTQVQGPSAASAAPSDRTVVDQTNAVLYGTAEASSGTVTGGVRPVTAPTSAQEPAVEFKWNPAAGTTQDSAEALFRVLLDSGDDERSLLKVRVFGAFQGTSRTNGSSYGSGSVAIRAVVDGAITGLLTTGTMNAPWYTKDWVRVVDTGSNIEVYQHGLRLGNFNYDAVAGWTSSGASAALASATRAGFGASATRLLAGRLVDLNSAVNVGEGTSRVLVLTSGRAQHGRLDAPAALSTCSGIGVYNQLPSAFGYNNKWYVVDGDLSKVVDPVANTVVDWTASTAGTLPAACRLAALYRGRPVLARQEDNPSIWYMGRVADPHDWDFGADPEETAAVAGTNADVGQPGDAITALIPFSDDYLLFGCASSLWMLEGDPGYGGAVQNVSYKTGVLSNRSWCFDEKGNLYFMGPGGLFVLPRGTRDPQNISGRRLATVLEDIDTDRILVQMAYDAFKGVVYIFLTNVAGTSQSIHVAYDIRSDAFFFDTYPTYAGPWSCCEITGTASGDRRVLLGGQDGFVRRFNDDAASDQTTSTVEQSATTDAAIDAWVRFAPLEGSPREQIMLTGLQFQGRAASDALSWELLTAESAEDVQNKTLGQGDVSGTVLGNSTGNQQVLRVRRRAGCLQLVVRQNTAGASFALERIVAHLSVRGSRA